MGAQDRPRTGVRGTGGCGAEPQAGVLSTEGEAAGSGPIPKGRQGTGRREWWDFLKEPGAALPVPMEGRGWGDKGAVICSKDE